MIDPGLRSAIREVCEGRLRWPLFIYGPAGGGKTRAVLCLIDCVMGEARYTTLGNLCDESNRVKAGEVWYPGPTGCRKHDGDFWKELGLPKLLVLDEIGARQNVSDAHYEVLKKVLDLWEGLPLVAVSNLGLREIAQIYDDRIASRLSAGTVVRVDVPDMRNARKPVVGNDEECWPSEYRK